MFACATGRLALVALLPSQTTCEAPCEAVLAQCPCAVSMYTVWKINVPVLDRRCIFVAACFAALAAVAVAVVVPTIFAVGLPAGEGA